MSERDDRELEALADAGVAEYKCGYRAGIAAERARAAAVIGAARIIVQQTRPAAGRVALGGMYDDLVAELQAYDASCKEGGGQ